MPPERERRLVGTPDNAADKLVERVQKPVPGRSCGPKAVYEGPAKACGVFRSHRVVFSASRA